MAGVQQKLMAFFDRAAKHPFSWGEHDCMLEVADWLDYACGLDAAGPWRGRYSTEAEADALMPAGLVAGMVAEAARLGLQEAAQPLPGDVGLVTVTGQAKPCGAIYMPSGRWRLKTEAGIVTTRDAKVLVAWTVPCRSSLPLHS
jgi:hypothetical protein